MHIGMLDRFCRVRQIFMNYFMVSTSNDWLAFDMWPQIDPAGNYGFY